MTKEQKQIAQSELIMLDMKDIQELTGWCENVVINTFAYDENFHAIKRKEISSLKIFIYIIGKILKWILLMF